MHFVEFCICAFRTVLRVFFYCESLTWERTEAFVTSQAVNEAYWYPSVRLHYKFDHRGVLIKGCDIHPFMLVGYAKEWASTFPHNFPVTIRVNPKSPQRTRFFGIDRKGAVRGFALVKSADRFNPRSSLDSKTAPVPNFVHQRSPDLPRSLQPVLPPSVGLVEACCTRIAHQQPKEGSSKAYV